MVMSGCSGQEDAETVESDRPAQTGPIQTPAPPQEDGSDAEAEGPPVDGEPREGELTRGANAAVTAEEKAAAETWFDYMEELVHVIGLPDPLVNDLTRLANGPALEGPRAYALKLLDQNRRNVGGMVATLQEIEVDGRTAQISGCLLSSMYEVDAAGRPQEELHPWFRASQTLRRHGETWIVIDHDLVRSGKCL